MKKRKHSGLGSFLNQVSTMESQNESKSGLIQIEIDKIKSNPGNFYGLRDIEKLAEQINLSRIVEPLIVINNPSSDEDGMQYLLISGHRRKAAWTMLLDQGKVTDRTLPCIIHDFKPMVLKNENGSEKVISVERLANMYLMLSNMGQREVRTVDERLEELNQLQPIARDIYDTLPVGERGNFRTYFATEFLSVSESYLQRLLALDKLTERAKKYVDDGKVSFVFGANLSSLSEEEQENYLDEIDNGIKKGTVTELINYKKEKKAVEQGVAVEPLAEGPQEEDEAEVVGEEEKMEKEISQTRLDDEPSEPLGEDSEIEDADNVFKDSADDGQEENSSGGTTSGTGEPADVSEKETVEESGSLIIEIEDLPDNIGDDSFNAKKEAENWVIKSLENARDFAKKQKDMYEDIDDLKCAQWSMRYGEALRQLAILRKNI